MDANYTEKGALSVLLEQGALASYLLPAYQDPLLAACQKVDPAIIRVELNKQWQRIKVHGVSTHRYSSPQGLRLAWEEIETGTQYRLTRDPSWLRAPAAIQEEGLQFSTMVIFVEDPEEARRVLTGGLCFGGNRYRTDHYTDLRRDLVCPRCCTIGHTTYRTCRDKPPRCLVCAGAHEANKYSCKEAGCRAKPGSACLHKPARCANCTGSHQAYSPTCPKIREARRHRNRTRQQRTAVPGPTVPQAADRREPQPALVEMETDNLPGQEAQKQCC